MKIPLVLAVPLVALTACSGSDRVHYEQLTGPYYLKANDLHEAMFLIRQRPPTESSVIVGPGVMTAGFNSRYLVATVEPPDFDNLGQRHPREYYYVDRVINEKALRGDEGIVGPLTLGAFLQHDKRLELPDFTWSNDGI